MKIVIILAVLSLLTGCPLTSAPAKYSYTSTKCNIEIVSQRDIAKGNMLITPDCGVEVTTEEARKDELINNLIKLVPE